MNRDQAAHSVSEANWLYTRPAFGRQGRSLSENNFQKERRDWLAVLLREVLQNALDARVSKSEPVHVRIERISAPGSLCNWLLPDDHLERLRQSLPHQREPIARPESFLVIEDFGTTGLTGTLNDPDKEGEGENWNAFWFREGEGGKEQLSGNGGAGQGKITYFSTSSVRTLFALTVRQDDQQCILYGASSFLRDYEYGGHKCLRDAYWGVPATRDDGSAMAAPIHAETTIERLCKELHLSRTAAESGVSLIIPGARSFTYREAIQVVAAEFFAPILRRDLTVQVGDIQVSGENIVALANESLSDERAQELHTCMTAGFRHFYADALGSSQRDEVVRFPTISTIGDLTEQHVSRELLEELKARYEQDERVAVRFAHLVKPKHGAAVECVFDVHIAADDTLIQAEQAFLRRDLLIGEEPIGGGKIRQKVRAVTIIPDSPLSRLLLCAEEPTHLRWNTRLPRLDEYYKAGAGVVALVRNAAARLLELLSAGERQREFKLLAKYFSAPGSTARSPAKGKRDPKGKSIPTVPVLPPPPKQLINLTPLVDGCRVSPTEDFLNGSGLTPLNLVIEFAYEGLDRDAFAEYDPLDFDLADKGFQVEMTGGAVFARSQNSVEARIEQRDFELKVRGFDTNLRLRIRLNYTEETDAAAIETE